MEFSLAAIPGENALTGYRSFVENGVRCDGRGLDEHRQVTIKPGIYTENRNKSNSALVGSAQV